MQMAGMGRGWGGDGADAKGGCKGRMLNMNKHTIASALSVRSQRPLHPALCVRSTQPFASAPTLNGGRGGLAPQTDAAYPNPPSFAYNSSGVVQYRYNLPAAQPSKA